MYCEVDEAVGDYLVLSDDATFHLAGKVNKRNIHLWGTEQSHVVVQVICDLPKVTMFFPVSKTKVHGPFFFAEATISHKTYLNILEQWLRPQLKENFPGKLQFPTGESSASFPCGCEGLLGGTPAGCVDRMSRAH